MSAEQQPLLPANATSPATAIGHVESKHPGGRPTVLTEMTIRKLVSAFQRGFNDTKAIEYARISRDAFYRHMREDQEFYDRITDAKNYWVLLSGEHITGLLLDKSPKYVRLKIETAKWVYEKHMRDTYGNQATIIPQKNTQNNFFLNNEQFEDIARKSGLDESDPEELFDAIETASDMDASAKEEGAS